MNIRKRRTRTKAVARQPRPAEDQRTAQWLTWLRAEEHDGTTWQWPAPGWQAAPVWEGASEPGLPNGTRVVLGRQSRSVMAVDPPRPGGPGPAPEGVRVAAFLRDRVDILRARGQLDRISEENLAMLPALPPRHTAVTIVSEAAALLRHGSSQRRAS